jgi:hypothetical protein
MSQRRFKIVLFHFIDLPAPSFARYLRSNQNIAAQGTPPVKFQDNQELLHQASALRAHR